MPADVKLVFTDRSSSNDYEPAVSAGAVNLGVKPMSEAVGVVGLGIMGGAIARNLVARGWSVIGFDVAVERRDELAAEQVRIVGSVSEVARAARIILTSLPSAASAMSVAKEIADSRVDTRIVIEASTLSLEDKSAFADILNAAGHVPLDCPLSGTGAQAAVRDLVVYASGESGAIAEVMPVFLDFARQAADVGAFGNGSRMKFVANYLVAIHNVATAEAMLLAERAGLDLSQVVHLVGAGAGGSRMFEMRAPMMAAGRYEPATMRMSTWKKDMEIIDRFSAALDCPTPLFSTTGPIYDEGLRQGLGDLDTAAVHQVLKARLGSK